MTYQIDNINIDGNRELTTAINDYLESNIHNQLVRNGSDDVFKEIRSYQSELKNELNKFNDYFENNEGEIIENNNFEEGYNSRTGSIESFDTLLTEYKLDKQNEIKQNNLDKLSVEAQKELQKSFDLAGMNFESSLVINQYPDIQKELLNINNNLKSLSEVYNKNLKEISLSISDDMKSYTIIAKDTSDKEEIINGDLPNISKEYDKQNKIDYSSKDNSLDNKNITSNIDESLLQKSIEYNRQNPNNPYGTIEDFINQKSDQKNLENAYEIMNNLNLNYNDSVEFYNKVNKEVQLETDKLINSSYHQNASGEIQSHQLDDVKNKVLKDNGVESINNPLKDITKLYAIKNSNEYLSEHIENYKPNHQAQNQFNEKNIETDKSNDLDKLKSVELEKNVIGLLPKDQQEKNFKETLSRLEKNQNSLKDSLKNSLNNTKIDNAINSVKQHFENIKVRAEDIHKTFKDLGSWNTDNKFVKDINSVIEKVKDLSQKQNNKLDINDPDLLKKLEAKFKESNDYINKMENRNYQETQLKNNRIDYLSKELEILNPDKLNESNQITNHLSQLSTEDKIKLYNHSKDIESITKNLNFDEPDKIKTMIETHKITNSLESDLGKNYLNEHRKSYLTSSEKKPSVNDSLSNTTLKDYMNNSNDIIKNATRNDLKNYQARGNTEIKNINETQKANTLKNNDLLQKYNQQNSNQQQNNNIQESEVNNEKKQQVKSKGIQLG